MGQESLGQVPDSWRPPSGIRVHATNDVLSDIISTSVLILIKYLLQSGPADFMHRSDKYKVDEIVKRMPPSFNHPQVSNTGSHLLLRAAFVPRRICRTVPEL